MHISINNGVNNVLIESNSASKLRLAAYIRVSTESEEQENSFETQMKYFENLTSNAEKYAEPAAEIFISTIETAQSCGFSVMNTCTVSGCQAESNGIGIESIRTMMQKMNGTCTVEQTETVFEIALLFPKQ